MIKDSNGKLIKLEDYKAQEVVGVQIGSLGHKLWICIDGVSVLRVIAPQIDFADLRVSTNDVRTCAEQVLSTFKNYNRLHQPSPGLDKMQDAMSKLEESLNGSSS